MERGRERERRVRGKEIERKVEVLKRRMQTRVGVSGTLAHIRCALDTGQYPALWGLSCARIAPRVRRVG